MMEDWLMAVAFVFAIVIPLGGLIIKLYQWSNERNDAAHRQIGENIGRVDGKVDRVDGKVDRVDGKVDVINNDLKELNRSIGRLEGPQRNRTDAEP